MSRSPLRYPGGKSKAIAIIEKIIIENFDLKDFFNNYFSFCWRWII
jgi:site-specific DNA-adenine methylase